MTDFITVTGTLGTDPEHRVVGDGLNRTTFRIASSERRRVAGSNEWEDHHTNWYSVTCWGRLATNAKASLEKGQRVIVAGKLRISSYTRDDNSQGTQVEIIANSAGHDLSFQTATATKRPGQADREAGRWASPGAGGPAAGATASPDALAGVLAGAEPLVPSGGPEPEGAGGAEGRSADAEADGPEAQQPEGGLVSSHDEYAEAPF